MSVTSANIDLALSDIIKQSKPAKGATKSGKRTTGNKKSVGTGKAVRGRGSVKLGVSGKRITKSKVEKRANDRVRKAVKSGNAASPRKKLLKRVTATRKTTYAASRARNLTKKAVQRQQAPKRNVAAKSLAITVRNSPALRRQRTRLPERSTPRVNNRRAAGNRNRISVRVATGNNSRQRQMQQQRDARSQISTRNRADRVAAARGVNFRTTSFNNNSNNNGNNRRRNSNNQNNRGNNNNNRRNSNNSNVFSNFNSNRRNSNNNNRQNNNRQNNNRQNSNNNNNNRQNNRQNNNNNNNNRQNNNGNSGLFGRISAALGKNNNIRLGTSPGPRSVSFGGGRR